MSFKPIYTLLDWIQREDLNLDGLLYNIYAVDLLIELEEIPDYCDNGFTDLSHVNPF